MKLYEPITLFLAVLFLGGIVIGEILERRSQSVTEETVIEYEEDCRYWSDIGGEKAWIGEDCGG